MTTLRRLAREPLVHFLALGALLFLYFSWRGDGAGSRRIVVTPGRIEHLVAGFTRTWQRPPSEQELKALLDDYVREEIAAREAVAMGLDAEDTIIRRRLRQKLEFVVEDAAAAPPTEEELEQYLRSHAEQFRSEPAVSLRQVYVSRDRRGAAAQADAARLLEELRRLGPEAALDDVGDALMVPQELERAPRSEVARLFGEEFADAVLAIEPGAWTGPVESGYGLHLVLVRERREGGLPELAVVRQQVERDLLGERRREQLDAVYEALLEKYTVVIERGEGGEGREGGT